MFLSREEFERWIEEDRFLEWAEYSGNLYGTPEGPVDEMLDDGRSVILEIELQGARQVRNKRPDAVMVFVRTPSIEETRRRLEGRATESSEALERRMATAVEEMEASGEFDHEVVNDKRDDARERFVGILREIAQGGKDAERPQD